MPIMFDTILSAEGFDVSDVRLLRHKGHVSEQILEPRLGDLSGRLLIAWGEVERAWIQRADRQEKLIRELRTEFNCDSVSLWSTNFGICRLSRRGVHDSRGRAVAD